jgi:zinc-ribbon domain
VYCSKCGAAMVDGATFCTNCWQNSSVAARPAPPMPNVPAYAGVPMAAAPRVEYAGFWLRAVAFIIDNVVIGLVQFQLI